MNLSRIKSRFGLNREDAPNHTGFFFYAVRFLSILLREYQRDRINLRAAALTYSVVLSLVPMLALSTAVLKGMGAGDQMREAAYRLIDNLSGEMQKSEAIPLKNPPADPVQTEPQTSADHAAKPQPDTLSTPSGKAKDFSTHLNDAVNKVFDYVDRTNFAALGAIGTFLLLITVLIVINGIEEAMNAIWKVERSRSAGRKVINYMALLIICPLAVNLGIGATTMLNTPAISQRLEIFFPLAWMQALLFKLAPLLLLT
ncbi:MAG: YihY/virulence factor BrkB family protein, partial [Deltaproteobacteria bacterium]|nr:YihY/virulence factor BrkB family protein [Deltaproteobacteria bacterium]